MSKTLTKAQHVWLSGSQSGGITVANMNLLCAPVRRLIVKGLVARSGTRRGRAAFKITESGRLALKEASNV